MRPRTSRALVLALSIGCAGAPTPPPAPAPSAAETRTVPEPAVAELSAKAEALLRSQDELVWKHWLDGSPADLAKTYAGSEAWLVPDAVQRVARARASARDAKEARALEHLHAYLAGEWLAQQLTDVSDAIAKLESSLTFPVAGTDRPYRNLEALLANEKSALRRRQLYEGATPAVGKISALLDRRAARSAELLGTLGLEPEAWTRELREVDVASLRALADDVLSRTQGLWTATLVRLAQRDLQLPLSRIGRPDLPRLVRLQPLEAAFAKDTVVPRARTTLAAMGLDVGALKTVTLDVSDRPEKNPRGLVLGVVVPSDVRVSLKPVGGVRDQRGALHELGHAVHDAYATERRFELGKLGNRTVSEAAAALVESLSANEGWLATEAGVKPGAERAWVESVTVQELFLVRRAAGKVLFNVDARKTGADVAAVYRTVIERTYGLPPTAADEARRALDVEDTLGSADYLRGWLLAAQLRARLEQRSGPTWWREGSAGEFLKSLLAPGNAVSADELAAKMGDGAVKADAWIARVTATLATPPPSRQSPAQAAPASPTSSGSAASASPGAAAPDRAPTTLPAAGATGPTAAATAGGPAAVDRAQDAGVTAPPSDAGSLRPTFLLPDGGLDRQRVELDVDAGLRTPPPPSPPVR